MLKTFSRSFLSPIGYIIIQGNEKAIFSICFSENPIKSECENQIIDVCINQLTEYFNGTRTIFTFPLDFSGTEFQKKVWNICTTIPYGETSSYLKIAKLINSPKSSIAVGQALKKNPIAIIIPCHRILNSQGKNTGYAGGMWRKDWLLDFEKSF